MSHSNRNDVTVKMCHSHIHSSRLHEPQDHAHHLFFIVFKFIVSYIPWLYCLPTIYCPFFTDASCFLLSIFAVMREIFPLWDF